MNEFQNYLESLKKKDQESIANSQFDETDTSNSDEDVESFDLEDDDSLSHNSLHKSTNISIKKPKKWRKSVEQLININSEILPQTGEEMNYIKETHTLKAIKEENKKFSKTNQKTVKIPRNSSEKVKINQGKSNSNSYYKVNLNNVRLMIYDFNRDMVVEDNKNKINCKVEDIIL